MIIIDCKNQQEILRALKLKHEFYGIENFEINESDFYNKYLIINKDSNDIGAITLKISDGSAEIIDFIINDEPNNEIVITILNTLGDYCKNHQIKSVSVETTVEQSGVFKDAGFVIRESLYLVEEYVLTTLIKSFV